MSSRGLSQGSASIGNSNADASGMEDEPHALEPVVSSPPSLNQDVASSTQVPANDLLVYYSFGLPFLLANDPEQWRFQTT
jgi:hypothetical protein